MMILMMILQDPDRPFAHPSSFSFTLLMHSNQSNPILGNERTRGDESRPPPPPKGYLEVKEGGWGKEETRRRRRRRGHGEVPVMMKRLKGNY